MAGLQSNLRRLRRRFITPYIKIFQIIFCFCIIAFAIRFLIKNNHDPVPILPPLNHPHPVKGPSFTSAVDDPSIPWQKYAYVQYVTTPEYLCNALMIFSELHEFNSKASRVLLYPSNWSVNAVDEYDEALRLTPTARLLQQALEEFNVVLDPVDILHRDHVKQATWADSYTKLLAFNLTQYDRVITLDSDSVVLQSLDELFLMEPAPLAIPYVYWGEPVGWQLSSQLMVVTPSSTEFSKVEAAIEAAGKDEYDMDIVDKLYHSSVVKLPQRPYDLLTGEFRREDHSAYLSSSASSLKWDAKSVLAESKFVHFSDWPVPKPWIRAPKEALKKYTPLCKPKGWFWAVDCSDREAWLGFYWNFAVRRKNVCGQGFELQSRELPPTAVMRHGKWYQIDEVT